MHLIGYEERTNMYGGNHDLYKGTIPAKILVFTTKVVFVTFVKIFTFYKSLSSSGREVSLSRFIYILTDIERLERWPNCQEP